MITIGPMTRPDLSQVSALLSTAFAQDPSYQYFLADSKEAERARLRTQLVGFIVACHWQAGGVVWGVRRDNQLLACALLEVPVSTCWRVLAMLRHLPRLLGKVPLAVIMRMNRYAAHSRNGLPANFDYYLVKIGVAPSQQGRGYGKQLLRALLEHCRTLTSVLALDTENPDKVSLYQHLGFQLHDEYQIDTLKVYRMFYRFE